MLGWAVAAAAVVTMLGCSSDSEDPTRASGTGGNANTDDASSDAPVCDPRPNLGNGGSPGSGGTSQTEGGVIVADGGNIDLDSGGPPPWGYLKCYDADTGAGFVCEDSGQVCCEKKDNCWDPATEPTFCDLPWCPTN
jgi:hypothetical protein